ncbi:type I-D CRISPR-associated protein Cas5/Csc1 [Phosphitispora sp. TUW77]|uniref:type I-D CRISPR-associated protein Cas5/Csc1 n=1 Tax=Phosphitispora sp. TUW77 TaxID=3152361 RepID=UPI003AB4F5BF
MMSVELNKKRIRLFAITLEPMDLLWFASYDASGLANTETVIHNYALTYALSRFERGIVYRDYPTYEEDLLQMQWYCVPAKAEKYEKMSFSWNAINSCTHQTLDANFNKRNTPMLGRKNTIVPIPYSKFTFYAFNFNNEQPVRVIRLGKKRTPCRLIWEEIANPVAIKREQCRPSHCINPLDVQGNMLQYQIVSIPPSLVLKTVIIQDDWEIRSNNHFVHVPQCVCIRGGFIDN